MRLAIVASRFNEEISSRLLERARAGAAALGIKDCFVAQVPGALEIPIALQWLAQSGRFDALVALGCVIRGETYHFEIVAGESARGINDLAIGRRIAIGNGVLTVENEAQALARARAGEGDKGGGAAKACLAVVAARKRLLGQPR